VVAHACNLSYLGARDRRIMPQGQPGQKLLRPFLKNKAVCGGTHLYSQPLGDRGRIVV
jgi:hypothetical protein